MENSNKKTGLFGFAKNLITRIWTPNTEAPPNQLPPPTQQQPLPQQDQLLIDSIFTKVTGLIKTCKTLKQEQQLVLYGLFKQATQGNCNRPKPSLLEMQANAKYNAWKRCAGLSKNEAKMYYIQTANEYDPTISPKIEEGQVEQPNQQGGSSEPLAAQVSRPKVQNEQVYDHPYFSLIFEDKPIEYIDSKLLTKFNSEPNILPLHFAIDNQRVAHVKQFLQHMTKEEVKMPDGEGMDAMEYAELIQNQEIVALLKQKLNSTG